MDSVASSTLSESISFYVSFSSVVPRKARAVYPCEAEHSSELSFRVGAIFEDGKYCMHKHQAVKTN